MTVTYFANFSITTIAFLSGPLVRQIAHLQMQLAQLAVDIQVLNRHVGLVVRYISLLKPET